MLEVNNKSTPGPLLGHRVPLIENLRYVFGVIKTHYGCCVSGVARAFNEEIHTHPALLKVVQDYWGADDVNAAKLKLAQVGYVFSLMNRILGQFYAIVQVKKIALDFNESERAKLLSTERSSADSLSGKELYLYKF